MNPYQRFDENLELAYACLHKYYKTHAFDEDYQQAAFIGLWKACLRFDATRGVAFSTYAYPSIRSEVAHMLRSANAKKRVAHVISLDAPMGNDGPALVDIVSQKDFSEDCCTRIDLQERVMRLADLEKKVVYLYAAGMVQSEIGAAIGKSQTQVCRIIKRMRGTPERRRAHG